MREVLILCAESQRGKTKSREAISGCWEGLYGGRGLKKLGLTGAKETSQSGAANLNRFWFR